MIPGPAPAAAVNQQAPSFDKKIHDCEVQPNSEAKFECTLTGMPAPVAKWYVLLSYFCL